MRLFSVRRTQPVQNKKRPGRRIIITAGFMMTLFMAAPLTNSNTMNSLAGTMTVYAAETTQTPTWFQDTIGNWKVRDGSGNLLKSVWFCDLDNAWYLLDEQGCMREGIIEDGGHYYSLETSHQGHYGKMRTENGSYNGVYLTFNQEHSGTYGEILSGVTELINTGITVTHVKGLPTTYVYAKDFISAQLSNTATPEQAPTSGSSQISDNQNNNNLGVGKGLGGHGGGYTHGEDASNFIVGG